jgi:hypothetical protein
MWAMHISSHRSVTRANFLHTAESKVRFQYWQAAMLPEFGHRERALHVPSPDVALPVGIDSNSSAQPMPRVNHKSVILHSMPPNQSEFCK